MAESGTLTRRALGRATLARQMLLQRERLPALKAVERLVALQAQWPRPPYVGLWTRLAGFERSHLTALLRKRQVVRATFVRATLHLVTAKDFLALRPSLQPMLDGGLAAVLRDRAKGLDAAGLAAQARRFLAKGPRTFEEVREHLAKDTPGADVRAMGYAVRLSLPLVQVPTEAESPWAFPTGSSFAVAEDWLGRPFPRGAGTPAALVMRYLAGYGPSSLADIQAWSGFNGLRETVEALRPRLRVFRDEQEREVFDVPDAPRPPEDVPAPVRLVPEYDNLITARTDDRFVAKADRSKVYLSALRIAATVLVDGRVAGTWRIDRTKSAAVLTIVPFTPLPARAKQDALAEAEALLRFVEPDASTRDVRVAK
ncbi:MAG TPA: winged helix DNA-binding domain-containing protein [Vicinamibacteria bacterium]|nr:winged helix DNA-binding domain-containing protein [Vicinamibacteria bacterium]